MIPIFCLCRLSCFTNYLFIPSLNLNNFFSKRVIQRLLDVVSLPKTFSPVTGGKITGLVNVV